MGETRSIEKDEQMNDAIENIVETMFGFNHFDRFEILKKVQSILKKDRDKFIENKTDEIEQIKNLDY